MKRSDWAFYYEQMAASNRAMARHFIAEIRAERTNPTDRNPEKLAETVWHSALMLLSYRQRSRDYLVRARQERLRELGRPCPTCGRPWPGDHW